MGAPTFVVGFVAKCLTVVPSVYLCVLCTCGLQPHGFHNNDEKDGISRRCSGTLSWVMARIVRSVSMRSKWAGVGAQKETPSASQLMSSVCQRFPMISYEIPSREKALRDPVTEKGGRAFPERTICELTILGASGKFSKGHIFKPFRSQSSDMFSRTLGRSEHQLCIKTRRSQKHLFPTTPHA